MHKHVAINTSINVKYLRILSTDSLRAKSQPWYTSFMNSDINKFFILLTNILAYLLIKCCKTNDSLPAERLVVPG